MKTVECYGRWQGVYAGREKVDGIVFTGPDRRETRRPVFRHQPVELHYDEHGYENIAGVGDPATAARFTPDQPTP